MAETAEALGKPLMPHMRYVADVAMEIDPETGLLAYGEVIIVGPRQGTGKSEFLFDLMTTRCTRFRAYGPQNVIYVAQTADEARKKWRRQHLARLKATKKYRSQFTPALTTNKEAFYWRNGSVWSPGSATGRTSATGDTCDQGVIDEAWAQTARTELGMRPTMLTRESTQLVLASMVPGISRALPGTWKYLENKMAMGRARVEADVRRDVCYIEFSAPEGMDPGDPATWRMAIPGLGITVNPAKIRADYEAALTIENGLIDFEAEYLGWAPKATRPRWQLISEQTWSDREESGSTIVGAPALALVIDDDRAHGVIAAAGASSVGPGRIHIEVVEPGGTGPDGVPADVVGVEWMLPRVLTIVAKLVDARKKPSCVVVDPRRSEASLIVPLKRELARFGVDVVTPSALDVGAACGRFYDASGQVTAEADGGTRLVHIGQAELNRAMSQAVKLDLGSGAFTIVKRGTASVLINPYACVLAMHGHEVHVPTKVPRSKVW